MNKLDVALKLLRLLNERKAIDSKTVARELDVSLRTAQRYLIELSILPCVASDSSSHSYYLNPDYRWSEALVDSCQSERAAAQETNQAKRHYLGKSTCALCGSVRAETDSRSGSAIPGQDNSCAVSKMDGLGSIVSRRFKKGRGYP